WGVEDGRGRRLPEARRPDEGGDVLEIGGAGDVLQRAVAAVEEIEFAHRDLFLQSARLARGVGDDRDRTRAVNRSHAHATFLDDASARAVMLKASTVMVMISAPVHAKLCHS